jgi:hypothetical protein
LTQHANNLYEDLYYNNLLDLSNRNDTPAQVEVSLDETPQTGITRHTNSLYDNPTLSMKEWSLIVCKAQTMTH